MGYISQIKYNKELVFNHVENVGNVVVLDSQHKNTFISGVKHKWL